VNRTFRTAVVVGAFTALCWVITVAALSAPACAFAQDTVALPAPGAVPELPPGLPAWLVTLLTAVFTLAPIVVWLYRLGAPLIQSHTRKAEAAHTFQVVEELAASVVAVVEVRIKPKRQLVSADGLTAAEAQALQLEAIDLFMQLAPPSLLRSLGDLFGTPDSVRTYITGLLERANAASSVDAHPAPIPPPAPTV